MGYSFLNVLSIQYTACFLHEQTFLKEQQIKTRFLGVAIHAALRSMNIRQGK
jgi:hypothetical protein